MSAAKRTRPATPKATEGPGRGQPQAQLVRAPDRSGFGLEARDLPTPPREFECDLASAKVAGAVVRLLFDQLSLHLGRLSVRSRAEIRMPYEPFAAFASTLEQEGFARGFRETLTKLSAFDPYPQRKELTSQEVESQAIVRAHLGSVAQVGSDAELRFYALSVGDLSRALQKDTPSRVELFPVLRITTTIHALGQFVDDCRSVAETLTVKNQQAQKE